MSAIDAMIDAAVKCGRCGVQGVGNCDCWSKPPPTCEAKIIPLRERRMRACGKPGRKRADNRVLCSRHEAIRKKNAPVSP